MSKTTLVDLRIAITAAKTLANRGHEALTLARHIEVMFDLPDTDLTGHRLFDMITDQRDTPGTDAEIRAVLLGEESSPANSGKCPVVVHDGGVYGEETLRCDLSAHEGIYHHDPRIRWWDTETKARVMSVTMRDELNLRYRTGK